MLLLVEDEFSAGIVIDVSFDAWGNAINSESWTLFIGTTNLVGFFNFVNGL